MANSENEGGNTGSETSPGEADKQLVYARSLLLEISKNQSAGKQAQKFNRVVATFDNSQLISIAGELSRLIELSSPENNLLENLLDAVLEKIEGNL